MYLLRILHIAIAIRVIFLTNLETWSFNLPRMAHDLQHAIHTIYAVTNTTTPNNVQHNLLHRIGGAAIATYHVGTFDFGCTAQACLAPAAIGKVVVDAR